MNLVEIANALHALTPNGISAYQGEAPGSVSAPWIVTNLESPDFIEGESSTLPAGVHTWRVTVAAKTATSCIGLVGEVVKAWQNVRVPGADSRVGSLRGPTVTGPYKAGLTATDTDLRYQVAHARFTLVIS